MFIAGSLNLALQRGRGESSLWYILFAMINYSEQIQLTEDRIYFGLLFRVDRIHRGGVSCSAKCVASGEINREVTFYLHTGGRGGGVWWEVGWGRRGEGEGNGNRL